MRREILEKGALLVGREPRHATTRLQAGKFRMRQEVLQTMLQGVHFFGNGATTNSIVMRSRTSTIRRIQVEHHWEGSEPYHGS